MTKSKVPISKIKTKTEVKANPNRKVTRKAKKEEPKVVALVQLHNIQPPYGTHKKRKYLGRGPGSGHGKTSTRGSKGQTSRSGRDFYPGFEGGQTPLIRRIPKRGFTSKFKKEYQLVNLSDLGRINELEINLDLLKKRGLIKDVNKRVKILGDGEIKSAISIKAHAFSKSASDKIARSGGKIELIDV